MGLLVAFGDDAELRRQRRRVPPALQAAAAAVPEPAPHRDQPAEHPDRAHPRRGLLRGHDATPCSSARAPSCSSASTRSNVQGHLALRRAVPVLAVLLHHRDLGVVLGEGVRRRAVQRPHPRRARGPDAVARARRRARSRSCSSTSTSTSTSPGARAATRRCRRSRCCRSLKAEFEQGRELDARCCRRAPTCSCRCASCRRRAGALVLHPLGVLRDHPARAAARPHARQGRQPEAERRQPAQRRGRRRPGSAKAGDALEQFAPAQFQDFSTTPTKLSQPGVRAASTAALDAVRRRAPTCDSSRHGQAGRPLRGDHHRHELQAAPAPVPRRSPAALFELFLGRQRASPAADISLARAKALQPFEETIAVSAETYTVAFQANNQAYAAERLVVRQRGERARVHARRRWRPTRRSPARCT